MNIDRLNARLMYGSRAKIYREEEEVLSDLSKTTKLKLIEDDVPCKLSIRQMDKAQVTSFATQEETFKLFTTLKTDIRSGDTLEIRGKKYTAGEALYYPFHKEILLKRLEI